MELTASLAAARSRISPSEYTAYMGDIEELANPPDANSLPLPDHGWAFRCEDERGAQPDPRATRLLTLPPRSLSHNLNEQNQARANRRLGIADEVLVVGNFVAFRPNYKTSVPADKRQEYWLGKIVQLDAENELVYVRYYHTSCKANASKGSTAYWRLWNGSSTPKADWIPMRRMLIQIPELTSKSLVPSGYRRRIVDALKVPMTQESESGGEDDGG